MRLRPFAWIAVALAVSIASALRSSPAGADTAPAKIVGEGSSYVGLAMQQWVADGQSLYGLNVTYAPTDSPSGLSRYTAGLVDFAGTEAEFSALSGGNDTGAGRGYQYVPDVAGAVAIMYNVDDKAGSHVNYLHLARRTVARIFMGDISNWSDPAITADNKGIALPDHPINVVYRGGQSGTTALFYDFVSHIAPDVFGPWAAKNQLRTNVRIIELQPGFAPKTQAYSSSDQIAQFVASGTGKWSIAYDEFGYAKTYGDETAWIDNASGKWVQPYAENISAALESATLRADLSQELSGVYTSANPLAYAISAYSYMVTQCLPGDRPSCKGAYTDPGTAVTLSRWMRYIACDGQSRMADIGYSPLPPNLSQEIASSIGRINGTPPEALNAANCHNPRFNGSLGKGAGSPADPLANVAPQGAAAGANGPAGKGAAAGSGAAKGSGAGSGTITPGATATGTQSALSANVDQAGVAGSATKSAGGGSTDYRKASPVAYARPGPPSLPSTLLLAFLALIALPPLVVGALRWRRNRLS
jgi:phosphate transport system substrate-binding protein